MIAVAIIPKMVSNPTGPVQFAILAKANNDVVMLTASRLGPRHREFPAAEIELAIWSADAEIGDAQPDGTCPVAIRGVSKHASLQTGGLDRGASEAVVVGIGVVLSRYCKARPNENLFGPDLQTYFANTASKVTFAEITKSCPSSHLGGEL